MALSSTADQSTAVPRPAGGAHRSLGEMPYFQRLRAFENAFPALRSLLDKLSKDNDTGREVVESHYRKEHQRGPGRCYYLKFEESTVSPVVEGGFESPAALRAYLEANPARNSREVKKNRRLFILEDLEPDYVDALGDHLGVGPLVFAEQMNTWNFTSSWSIPHRTLPSMLTPEQSFTLRYYELRTLTEPRSIDVLSMQMTFAVNRRRYERWRDIDVPSAGKPDRRHGFVRRCASFWTSQDPSSKVDSEDTLGWDAVILVDPPFANTCKSSHATPNSGIPVASMAVGHASPATKVDTPVASRSIGSSPTMNGTAPANASAASLAAVYDTTVDVSSGTLKIARTGVSNAAEAPRAKIGATTEHGPEECLILKHPTEYSDRASLWRAQEWGISPSLEGTWHKSWPYHDGCSTLAPIVFSQIGIGAEEEHRRKFEARRDLVSPFDELVFCWTKLASPELVRETNRKSSNAAYYLLKHTAQHWIHQLELINTTIAKAEWFSDDYQAHIDDKLNLRKWKSDLIKVNYIARDINYMRRHLNHFWRAMYLNLERLGVQLGSEAIDESASLALKGAQKDFLTIHTRMQPLRDRAEALNSVAQDLSNLHTAFRGVYAGEFGLRLSLFAAIIFPLTLVAGIFSIDNEYKPGHPQFWQLWAIGVPLCLALALGLVYGTQPWKVSGDLRGSTGPAVSRAIDWWAKTMGKDVDKKGAEITESGMKKQQKATRSVSAMKRDEEQGGGV